MAVGPQTSVLAPRFTRAVFFAVIAVCGITAVSLVQWGHVEVTLRALPAVLLVAAGAYLAFWRPRIVLTPTTLIVVNPFRTLNAPWPAVEALSSRWTLTVRTSAGSFPVWSAPAQSPWSAVGDLRRDALGRPSLARSTGERSGASSIGPLVAQQWEAHRDSGDPNSASVATSIPAVVVFATLAVLTVAGILWP